MAQPRRPMPVLDFDHNEYAARVSVARLPTYSEPYPNGVPLPDRHYGGGRRIVLVQGWVSPDGEYLSARTKANEWIVVWSLKDWEGRPAGVNFLRHRGGAAAAAVAMLSIHDRGQARHASKLAAWENFGGTSEVGHQELPG